MANISGLLGTAGGYKGTGVDAPTNWVDTGKLEQSNANLQTQFGNQNSLLGALQAQNGLGNQSSVFNQMQGIANGTGPNPAQAQLAQATGANTANQAALMAGQRGAGQNAGLIARQAAMQGGANQQNAAGQAATLQAQQSLGALGQMGGMANTMASNQIGQTNANTQAAQANQAALLGGNANQNAIKSNLIQATGQQQAAIGGGTMNGVGSAMAGAEGGKVEELPKMSLGGMFGKFATMFADGGDVSEQSAYQGASKFGQFLNQQSQDVSAQPIQTWGNDQVAAAGTKLGKGIAKSNSNSAAGEANEADMESAMAEGGKVPVLLSPGEKKLSNSAAKKVAQGGNPDVLGEEVAPGVKPKVGGAKNDYKNDVIKDNVEEGSIILPRSVTQSKHPHWAAMKFVQAHLSQKGSLPAKPKAKDKK